MGSKIQQQPPNLVHEFAGNPSKAFIKSLATPPKGFGISPGTHPVGSKIQQQPPNLVHQFAGHPMKAFIKSLATPQKGLVSHQEHLWWV